MTKNRTLWIIQGLLALVFLFSGGFKLVLPAADLVKQAPMFSATFLRFIGVCEVLGAIGLILPMLLRIRPILTPLAAACLVVIMIGAIAVTLMTEAAAVALFPLIVGALLSFVAYGRWRVAALKS